MNENQIRTLRSAINRDVLCYMHEGKPFLKKNIKDVAKITKTKNYHILYQIKKCDNNYILYSVDFKHVSYILYVIILNEKVIYYKYSSIFAEASSAFQLLTETYLGYRENVDEAIYDYKTTVKIEAIHPISWSKEEPDCFVSHTIISQEKADELASKCYYHV